MRPQDGSFAQGIPSSTDGKLISAGRSTALLDMSNDGCDVLHMNAAGSYVRRD
jgi:hypothetical protein